MYLKFKHDVPRSQRSAQVLCLFRKLPQAPLERAMVLAVSMLRVSWGSRIPLPVYQCSQAERLIESAS